MATVYRKIITRKLPAGAEIVTRKGERLAKWRDRKGRKRTAPLTSGRDGSDRITVQAGTYTAKYRDGQGIVRELATGCRDATGDRPRGNGHRCRCAVDGSVRERYRTGVGTGPEGGWGQCPDAGEPDLGHRVAFRSLHNRDEA